MERLTDLGLGYDFLTAKNCHNFFGNRNFKGNLLVFGFCSLVNYCVQKKGGAMFISDFFMNNDQWNAHFCNITFWAIGLPFFCRYP